MYYYEQRYCSTQNIRVPACSNPSIRVIEVLFLRWEGTAPFFHRLLYIINIKRVHRFSGLEIQFCSIFTVTGQQRGNYELQEVRQNYPESLYMPKKENVSLQQIDFRNRLALVLRLSLMPTQKTGYILTSLTCPPFFHRLFHIYKIKNGHLNFWSGNMPELSDQE